MDISLFFWAAAVLMVAVAGFALGKTHEIHRNINRQCREVGVLVIMEILGQHGIFSWLKYDPLRATNNWTVIVKDTRRDTNDPLGTIMTMAEELADEVA